MIDTALVGVDARVRPFDDGPRVALYPAPESVAGGWHRQALARMRDIHFWWRAAGRATQIRTVVAVAPPSWVRKTMDRRRRRVGLDPVVLAADDTTALEAVEAVEAVATNFTTTAPPAGTRPRP